MPPVNLLVKPASSLCNMRCRYCFYADVAQNRAVPSYGIMSPETQEALVAAAFAYAEGSCGFAFQGGEPTLAGLSYFERLIALEEQYNTKHLPVYNSIQTNGYVMDETWAAFLAKHRFLVGLSMDGPKDLHDACRLDAAGKGTHSRVMRAARLLEKHKVPFNILCVVNNAIARHAEQVFRFFQKNGLRYLQFIPCLDAFDQTDTHPYSLTAERYAHFLKTTFDLYYDSYCKGQYVSIRTFDNYVGMLLGQPPESCGMSGVCSCYFVAEGDGSIYPCDFYVLDEYRLGNITEMSFADMLQSPNAERFVEESRQVHEDCQNCRWMSLCRGGCRRNREPMVAGKLAKNQFCKAFQAFFEYAYDRLCHMADCERRSRQR